MLEIRSIINDNAEFNKCHKQMYALGLNDCTCMISIVMPHPCLKLEVTRVGIRSLGWVKDST
jgi:hypothetical protein